MVNLDVDGYTKTLNHRKTIRKMQKKQPTGNQNNTKTEKLEVRPSAPCQLRHRL